MLLSPFGTVHNFRKRRLARSPGGREPLNSSFEIDDPYLLCPTPLENLTIKELGQIDKQLHIRFESKDGEVAFPLPPRFQHREARIFALQ
jgi:hypothetical protein